MSESIDRRVVEMRFDNKDFEQNVNTTMTVLEKFKEKLSFKGAEKGFKDVSEAAKSTDFKGISSAVETVQAKFSALEVMAITALSNITNSAVNAGKRLVAAFTIDPIKTGFQEYETQINAVQTILANTASKGTKIEDVNKALDELNHYADKTIYNFTEMTRNIGTFTAAGIDLDTSVNAIQGIANLAAVSGSNAQQASTAMYQLSQALASGTVKLQDWNSVVNAGMGGEVFQNALKETAKLHGVAVDEMIKKNGSFRESLKEGWITSEVLTETLKKFTVSGVNEYLAKNTDLSKKQIESMRESADASKDWEKAYRDMAKTMSKNSNLTEDQIFEYLKMSKTAEDAATKVKTFSQLMDTLKEAAQSGWTQTWEILIGDFNEAKGLFTGISDVLSNLINASSDARNKVLQEWKDLGGRDDVLDSFKNMFKGLQNFITPIHDAFRNIFPPTTAEQLKSISDRFEAVSKSFMGTAKLLGNKLKGPFEDVFKAGKDIINLFTDAIKGLFDVITGSGGESAIFSAIVAFADFIGMLARGVSAIIAFTRATGIFKVLHALLVGVNDILFSVFDTLYSVGDGLSGMFSGIADSISVVRDALSKMLSGIGGKGVKGLGLLSEAFGKLFSLIGRGISHIDLGKVAALLAGGGILTAGLKISKLADTISEKLENLFDKGGKEGGGGLLDGVKETLSTLSDTLNQFQASLKIGQLVTIAISIGILAASCATLADIPAKKLAIAVGAVGGLFGELAGASHLMSGAQTKGIIAMSVAVVILAKAVKKMSEIKDMGKGLLGVGAILGELTAFCLIFDKMKIRPKSLTKTGEGLILMAVAINLLAKPIKELGALDTGQLIQGLLAMAAMLGGFTLTALAFSKIKTKGLTKAGAAMVVMAVAMRLLVKPLSELGSMDLTTLAKGLGAMGVALLELAGFTFIMSKIAETSGSIMKASAALLVMSIGIKIMASAISQMSSTENVGQGLSVLFGSLLILGAAMAAMQNSLAGAAAMIVVAGALTIMAPAIAVLSSLNIGGVATGLFALAGTLAVFGVGATLLAPVIPLMIALAAAMALLGVGVLSLGAGMTLLVAAFSMATGPIVEGATAISQAFPIIAQGIGTGIVTIIQTIGNSAEAIKTAFLQILDAIISVLLTAVPRIAEVGLQLILALMIGIQQNIGQITTVALNIIVNFVDAIAANIGTVVESGTNLIVQFVQGMADSLAQHGPELVTATQSLMLALLETLVSAIPGIGKAGAKAIEKYRKNLETGGKKAEKSAKKTGKSVEKGLDVDPKHVSKGTSKSMESFTKELDKAGKKSKTSSENASKNVRDGLKKYMSQSTGIGQNTGQGYVNGLNAKVDDAYRAGYAVGAAGARGEKDGAGVHSPSWKGFETGMYLVAGFINGMLGSSKKANKTANNIATQVVGSYNSALKSLDTISGTTFNSSITKVSEVKLRMVGVEKENARLAHGLDQLTKTLGDVTDTMNSRQMVNNINIEGSEDPNAFADALTRRMRLNARTL